MYPQEILLAALVFFHTRAAIKYKRDNADNTTGGNNAYKQVLKQIILF